MSDGKAGSMFEAEELVTPTDECAECRGHYGIHVVSCTRFVCSDCGHRGADEDHRGGCPDKRPNSIRWECQCGASGWMEPINTSLAKLVRQARKEHKCSDPDIERLETRTEYARRRRDERIAR